MLERLFLRGHCQAQVHLQLLRPPPDVLRQRWAQEAWRHRQRAVGRRYQTGRRGRLADAERASRWRAQQKNVTHQSSPQQTPDDVGNVDAAITAARPAAVSSSDVATPSRGQARGLGAAMVGSRCPRFDRTRLCLALAWLQVIHRGEYS